MLSDNAASYSLSHDPTSHHKSVLQLLLIWLVDCALPCVQNKQACVECIVVQLYMTCFSFQYVLLMPSKCVMASSVCQITPLNPGLFFVFTLACHMSLPLPVAACDNERPVQKCSKLVLSCTAVQVLLLDCQTSNMCLQADECSADSFATFTRHKPSAGLLLLNLPPAVLLHQVKTCSLTS